MDYTLRYDRGQIKAKHFTREGFLKVDAVFTRTGVFDYRNNDGTVRKELRHPQDVFKDDSLKTMQMLPMTLLHPKERVVDAENAKKVSVGFTGEEINHDGQVISGHVLITDKAAIAAVEDDDVQELSLGYNVELVQDEGEFNGERHDVRQTNIKYNHIALVPKGRAGVSKLILDAADAVQTEDDKNKDSDHPKRKKPKNKENKMDMVTVVLDSGIGYDAAPEIKNALDTATKKLDTAEKSVTTLTVDNTKLKADFDDMKVKLDKAEKIDHTDAIKTAVDARLVLVSGAIKHLDSEESKDIDKKTDSEIQIAVIKKYDPDFNKDGKDDENIKSDVYMKARFEGALANNPKAKNDKNGGSGIARQRQKMNQNTDSANTDAPDADKARNDYIERIKNQSKPATATV